jgi:uncharacterized caspase-like protein
MRTVAVDNPSPASPPRLFAIVIGNNDFSKELSPLKFAEKDAVDMARRLEERCRPIFSDVRVRLMKNAEKRQLLDALAEMAADMRPEDVFVFYVASHGVAMDDLYYIITSDPVRRFDLNSAAVSSIELIEGSKKVPALKSVFIFDTCQSGGVQGVVAGLYDARISVLAKSLGMHILAGAKTDQGAVDNYRGNGLFTHFLLRGIDGEADSNRNEAVTVKELALFLEKTVSDVSQGRQSAYVRVFGENFVIAGAR